MNAHLKGGKELDRKLLQLDRKVAKQIVSRALRAGAKVVHAAAKANAPKLTGLLGNSLKVRAAKRRRGLLRFFVQTKEGNYKGATFYGSFIEFGHKVGSRKLSNRATVAPVPYLSTAFEQKKEEALQAITAEIERGILTAT